MIYPQNQENMKGACDKPSSARSGLPSRVRNVAMDGMSVSYGTP